MFWRGFTIVTALLVLALIGLYSIMFSPKAKARIALKERGYREASYDKALDLASRHNDLEIARDLEAIDFDLNHPDPEGNSPLISAILRDSIDVARFLIRSGVAVNTLDRNHQAAIGHAVIRGQKDVIHDLLSAGAHPETPLGPLLLPAPIYALNTEDLPLLSALLQQGISPDFQNQLGEPLLLLAQKKQKYKALRLLLEQGASPNGEFSPGKPYLIEAIRRREMPIVRALLTHGADANGRDHQRSLPLHQAIYLSEPLVVDLLLKHHADPNFRSNTGKTALWIATGQGDEASVEKLLAHRADINAAPGTKSLLAEALDLRELSIAKKLLLAGADPNQHGASGRYLIEEAAERREAETVALLLHQGAKPADALLYAVSLNDTDIGQQILQHSPSESTRQFAGQTLVELGIRHGSENLVDLLLEYDANPEGQAREGVSLLTLAVALQQRDSVRALLAKGAPPEEILDGTFRSEFLHYFARSYTRSYLRYDQRITLLMLGVLTQQHEMVQALKKAGARVDRPTKKRRIWPIGMAAHYQDVKMMKILLGRDPNTNSRHVVISLRKQWATVYKNGKPALSTKVSTGTTDFETPTGEYAITNKHSDWTSNIYDAEMPFFMRLNCSAIGLHEGYCPGYPASHGCIRVPEGMAEKLFGFLKIGDRVSIVP